MDSNEIFVDALAFNEALNFGKILACIGIYIALFWLAVCMWVYSDAKKRYNDQKQALFIAVGVFILFFPALILYFAVRPDLHQDHFDMLDLVDGGVNVPVVNFTGKNGIQMTLDLNIFPKNFKASKPSDMKVDVKWESRRTDLVKAEKEVKPVSETKEEEDTKESIKQRIKVKFSKIIDRVKTIRESKKEDKPGD